MLIWNQVLAVGPGRITKFTQLSLDLKSLELVDFWQSSDLTILVWVSGRIGYRHYCFGPDYLDDLGKLLHNRRVQIITLCCLLVWLLLWSSILLLWSWGLLLRPWVSGLRSRILISPLLPIFIWCLSELGFILLFDLLRLRHQLNRVKANEILPLKSFSVNSVCAQASAIFVQSAHLFSARELAPLILVWLGVWVFVQLAFRTLTSKLSFQCCASSGGCLQPKAWFKLDLWNYCGPKTWPFSFDPSNCCGSF